MADISADSLLPSGDSGVILSTGQPMGFGSAAGSPAGVGFATAPAVNISSSLTTVFSLTGRRVTGYIFLGGIETTSGSLRVQLLIDGVVVMDQTETSSIRNSQLVNGSSLAHVLLKSNSSIELKAQKSGSTSVQVTYCSLAVI